jgi:ribonucleoside-diphosphate reductase alpha chain
MELYSNEETESGEISLCALGGIIPSFVESDEEYEDVAYYALLMVDKCIHKNKYLFPHLEYTAKSRLNAGVGMIGVAHELAMNGLNYTTEEGLKHIHFLSERHTYSLIKASLKLGKELGNAKWMHKTKWPEGWLPIDTYNREIDSIADFEYKFDWESLRKEIIANGGIRNSVLVAHMPTESSSRVTGLPNGVYPVRDIYLKKTDANNAIDYVARDSDKLYDKYQLAWSLTPEELCKFYGVIQKFTDQGISADFYSNRKDSPELKASRLLDEFFYMYKYGLKSRYYTNSLTTKSLKLEDMGEDKGCHGGFCTL